MIEVPQRIWAFHHGPFVGYFVGREEIGPYVAEYVQARLLAESEARRAALEEALASLLARVEQTGAEKWMPHAVERARAALAPDDEDA